MANIGFIAKGVTDAIRKVGDTTLETLKKASSMPPKIGDVHGGSGKAMGGIGAVAGGLSGVGSGLGGFKIPPLPSKAGGGGTPGVAGGKRTIRQGSAGQDVARCQNLLNMKLAYHPPPLWVDGIFGPKTHAKVLQFQGKCGIAVDGVVGPQTWAMLES